MQDATDARLADQYEAYPYPQRDPREEARRLIIGSQRYRYFEERLISEDTLTQLQQAGTLPIAVEPDFEQFIAGRRTLLDARLAAVEARAKDGLLPDVTIDRGVLKIAPMDHLLAHLSSLG